MAISETALISAGVQAGLVDANEISTLKVQARRERIGLLEAVTRAGRFPAAALYQAIADLRGFPFLQVRQLVPDLEVIEVLSQGFVHRSMILPVKDEEGGNLLVMADPDDQSTMATVTRVTGKRYSPALADPEAIETVLSRILRKGFQDGQRVESAADIDSVRLFDDIMKEVYLRRASDVHFEPCEGGMRIRLRVDGHMQEFKRTLDLLEAEALVSRIKVLASLDIAEQRTAQDGGMHYVISDWNVPEVDIRLATIPTRWGERATMRILGQETGDLSLEQLGMPPEILRKFRKAITSPHGIILVTGPTGSGKSTTLYTALRELDIENQNILTVEDPIEQVIDGISQVQVSGKVDFAQALRSFLRHDPDVILVGEIRDKETVQIGLRAAMTGHLVLSTLHTNDAVGVVTRLEDIGAERFLVGATLVGVLAQRLARRLCNNCRQTRDASRDELRLLDMNKEESVELFEPKGCPLCLGTGFRGRIGIFEAFWIDRDMADVIAGGAGEKEIRSLAVGLKSLWQDARAKVLQGEIYLSEVAHLRMDMI